MIDYRNFSNDTNSFETEEESENLDCFDPELDARVEEVSDYDEDTMTIGIVDRDKIYLRIEPAQGNDPIDVLTRGEELLIDSEKSTDEWYSVCTAVGQEGYVMKKLLKVE